MSEKINIWKEKIPVRFGNIDGSDKLTLWSIFDYFQEVAISHAESLGVGREAMSKMGYAWILSRLSLSVERRPLYRENIEVSTWPRKWDKLFALRDYCIKDEGGKTAVRGRGAWLIMDVERRRPIRAQALMEALPHNDSIDAYPEGPASLNPREDLVKTSERTAGYSDVDYFGHVNNARYIQWIQDLIGMDVLSKAEEIRLDINYLGEVLPGNTVELWTSKDSSLFACEGRREGTPVFRAELSFSKI